MDKLRFESLNDFLAQNNFDLKERKLKVLFFVKSNSRSHALNYWSNEKVDIAVVYCRSTIGSITDNFVISHELLHQFGAWDLYYGTPQSLEKAQEAARLYPYSIMINTYRNKHLLEVDELTAWRVGWNLVEKEEYLRFKPVRRKRPPVPNQKNRILFDLSKKKKQKNPDQ